MSTKPGSVFVREKASYRWFTSFRQIRKGANCGKVEVVLPPVPERKVLVDPADIRSYPVTRIVDAEFTPITPESDPGTQEDPTNA